MMLGYHDRRQDRYFKFNFDGIELRNFHLELADCLDSIKLNSTSSSELITKKCFISIESLMQFFENLGILFIYNKNLLIVLFFIGNLFF